MGEFKYQLYCSECVKVTPHDVIRHECDKPDDLGSNNPFLKAKNILIGIIGRLSSYREEDSGYQCPVCGNKF